MKAIPRIVIGATGSGAGKTTVTIALLGAMRARGLKVVPFKCGPDYLDPTYHARAAGTRSHNLDGWMMGRDAVLATFNRVARDADIAVIEGVMGLFDGTTPTANEGSTAEIAEWLDAPVLLTVDASGMARTVAAIAHGFRDFDPELNLAGLICNRVGSRGHLDLLKAASVAAPVLGGLPEDPAIAFPERHLGLFSAIDEAIPQERFESWAKRASEWLDLDEILALARAAPLLPDSDDAPETMMPRCRIGVAYDEAFHFYYDDNLRRLEASGAELVNFSPVHDASLPATDGLYFGGGYPEVMADRLSSNRTMLEAIRSFATEGGPIYAECGGLMYLARAIRTLDGRSWPMAGLLPTEAVMNERLQALGYAEVATIARSILGPAGQKFRGHQFRYSTLAPAPAGVERIYQVRPRWGGDQPAEGYRADNVVASFIHAHWASNPSIPAAFVDACAQWRQAQR
ncbi:MAG TPA: cobyrinate a,c-diamide synthase [Candidatus Binataceae bacterium]|jgi:cobyrinic acid a,c-diamide synthase|nr:cobyrinate a,c-diamide synthase [Candidatus Binataceae bacterium]